MPSTSLRVLLVSGLVMACTHAITLSTESNKVLDDVYGQSLSTACSNYFTTTVPRANITTDADVNALCTDITNANNATVLKAAGCQAADFTSFQNTACERVNMSIDAWNKKSKSFQLILQKLSGTCKTAAGTVATRADLEQLCLDVETNKKGTFQKDCTKDEYSKLKDAACDGASGVLVGLMTFGVCLVASLLGKQ